MIMVTGHTQNTSISANQAKRHVFLRKVALQEKFLSRKLFVLLSLRGPNDETFNEMAVFYIPRLDFVMRAEIETTYKVSTPHIPRFSMENQRPN